jgi:hypothetical protein
MLFPGAPADGSAEGIRADTSLDNLLKRPIARGVHLKGIVATNQVKNITILQ